MADVLLGISKKFPREAVFDSTPGYQFCLCHFFYSNFSHCETEAPQIMLSKCPEKDMLVLQCI